MHAIATLSLLAFAGSALAAPAPKPMKIVYETDVVTVIVTPGAPEPTQQPHWGHHPNMPHGPPAQPTSAVDQPAPSSDAPQPSKVGDVSSAAPSPTGSTSSGSGSGSGYMDVVNKWRSKLGLPQLTHSDKLEANSLKTCQVDNGNMEHHLYDGSMAQVLAPGQPSDFEKVFVGGWLCEKPDMAGMDGICSTMSQGWAYNGETGHADILSSTSYTQIGCANAIGLWGCDLA